MAVAYASVDTMLSIEPGIGSLSDLTSATIVDAFATPAEALVNAKIAKMYSVPVSGTVPLLIAVSNDITLYHILSRRVFTAQRLKNSTWPDRFKEALDILDMIASGQISLVNSDGSLVAAATDRMDIRSNTDGYQQTFHEGPRGTHVQDENKINDLLDNRDL